MSVSPAGALKEYEWTCDKCGRPVADRKGYICVDDRGARERLRVARKQEERRRRRAKGKALVVVSGAEGLADLEERGAPIRWEVWHRRCDPRPSRIDYWFSVERCRTLEDLLNWNAHLSAKLWVPHTDWHRFIQRRLAPNEIMQAAAR